MVTTASERRNFAMRATKDQQKEGVETEVLGEIQYARPNVYANGQPLKKVPTTLLMVVVGEVGRKGSQRKKWTPRSSSKCMEQTRRAMVETKAIASEGPCGLTVDQR